MMPKWVCKKCSQEFYGWGVYYKYKVGNVMLCPDCDGHLVLSTEAQKVTNVIAKLLTDTDDAA